MIKVDFVNQLGFFPVCNFKLFSWFMEISASTYSFMHVHTAEVLSETKEMFFFLDWWSALLIRQSD